MARFAVLRIVALALIVLAATAGLARATIFAIGDIDPCMVSSDSGDCVTSSSQDWSTYSVLIVSESGAGDLMVSPPNGVYSWGGYLGYESGSEGIATIDGAGSKWATRATCLWATLAPAR